MQIFDQEKGKSIQRSSQVKDPLQYFFIFDFTVKADAQKLIQEHNSLAEVKKDNFYEQGSYKLIPVAKNQVIMRIENLADRFDKGSNNTYFVNVEKIAKDLYLEINKKQPDTLLI